MNRKNKITLAIIIAITLIMVGVIVVCFIFNGKTNEPVITPSTDITDTESPTPEVPVIEDNGNDNDDEQKRDEPGEVAIDIEKVNDENKHNPDPVIEGDVIVIPGVKVESEESGK